MNTQLTRRNALKFLAGGALAAVPALKLAGDAAAGRSWCRIDPLFLIGDYLYDVSIGADEAMLTSATGPVEIVLTVPSGLTVKTIYQDNGFGYGYTVVVNESSKYKLSKSSMRLQAVVTAPAKDSTIPVEVTLSSLSSDTLVSQLIVPGTANQAITWSGKIEAVTLDKLLFA